MPYNEFVLRCMGKEKDHENQMLLTREIAYQVFGLNYLLSKKKPPTKDKFWPIGEKQAVISPEMQAAMIRAEEQYKKAVNG